MRDEHSYRSNRNMAIATVVVQRSLWPRAVWVMVPAVPEWRYGVEGDAMPWYPSVRLIRQEARGDWSDVFERVSGDLRQRFPA